jgi:hypothetical protein
MAGNPADMSNFGAKYLNTGKFGKKGRQAIKAAGYTNAKDFLAQSGVEGSRLPQTSIQKTLQSTLAAGNQPAQPTTPTPPPAPETPAPPAQNSIPNSLIQSATDQQNAGAKIMNEGNVATNPLLNAGANYQTGAQQDFGKVDTLAGAARAQGSNILNTLSNQQVAADQDIQNLFNAQPLDTLRSNLAQMNSAAQATGRTNSRSGNEVSAELQRGLLRDQAAARLGSNNQFRQATVNELGNQRTTDTGLAGMFSGQGVNQGQLGNQAINSAGQLQNDTNRLGADIYNQGFQNTLGGLGFANNAAMQSWNARNQVLQQYLANQQGQKMNRQAKNQFERQMQAQMEAAQGPGFMSNVLGGVLGGMM